MRFAYSTEMSEMQDILFQPTQAQLSGLHPKICMTLQFYRDDEESSRISALLHKI